jgi:hypothetical protein
MNAAAADPGLIAAGAFLAVLVIGSAGFAFAIVLWLILVSGVSLQF